MPSLAWFPPLTALSTGLRQRYAATRQSVRMDKALATAVRRQHGAVSRQQLLAAMSERTLRRQVANGDLARVFPGVYRYTHVRNTTATKLHAAILYAGPGAHLGHTTAAQVLGIDAGRAGRRLHVVVPAERTVQPQAGLVVHSSSRLSGAQVKEIGRLRVTTAVRTVIDLVDVLPRPELDIAIADAVRQGMVTVDYVLRQLDALPRRRNTRVLRTVLEELNPDLESVLEAEFDALLRSAEVELPVPQHEIWDGPLLVARVDFAYLSRRLAIEIDGYGAHSALMQFQRDRSRRRALKRQDWDVVEFTAADIRQTPEATVKAVRGLIASAAA